MLSFVCFLRPATLVFVSFFVFPILPDQEKPSYRKIISLPWVHCKTQGFFGDSHINFNVRLMVVNFPSADWVSNLTTQLKVFVDRVFLRAVFLNKFFSLEADAEKS